MNKKQGLVQSLLLYSFFSFASTQVQAQIIPDNTLKQEVSKLTPNVLINGANLDLIDGGAQRGNNLFHSFSEFNIQDGQQVYFANPSGVVNILTRVTGTQRSNILGTLGVDGGANLFLINPNGILFGNNASLDVRGSFVGTTANGLQFGNQGVFSATNPEAPALLTINPSALLFNQINQGAAIQNNALTIGLGVDEGKSLLLVGGNVVMDGGTLLVNALGKVQLIGTTLDGSSSSGLFARANEGSTGDGGDLTVNTQDLLVQDGALVSTSTLGAGKGGDLVINVSRQVELIGTNTDYSVGGLVTSADPDSTGNAGNLTINTQDLLVRDGALVDAGTFSTGKGGNLIINASRKVQLIGASSNGIPSGLFTFARPHASGDAGDLTINTQQLLIRDGAGVFVNSLGAGNAGILTVNADSTRLDSKASLNANTRSINKNPNREQATIYLRTQDLIMRRGSNITTNAQGANVIGGNININADVLAAFENSDISANSTDFRGGRVKITSQGIFGTTVRDFPTNQSDITATGASPTLSGTTDVNTPDVEPVKGVIELPQEVVDAARRVAQICPREPGAKPLGEFTITGRGSLPPSPLEALPGTTNSTKLATLENNTNVSNTPPNKAQNTIVEAQGWVKNVDGSMELVAMAPVTTANARASIATCPL